ncbi:MAG: cell division protein FtsA [Candidatus Paceibacterota bacterium]|nr:MAG: cell division protein FtsA [Candidatus Paceibacterota bacterium]
MTKQPIITGIDVGNANIKVVVATIDAETFRPVVIGAGLAPSHGMRKGMVTDMEEIIQSVRAAVQQAHATAQTSIRRAFLSVSGMHMRTQISRGVIAVSRADNEISQHDIDRVIQAASVISLPPNREIVHVIPRTFIVDGTEHVKNPLGMKGVRLEAEVLIVEGMAPHIRNVVKCINEAGIEVAGLVYAPLAASLGALDKNQKEYGVVHLDIGGGTSSLAVFEESDLIHTALFPVGSRHITNDVAIALRTSMDVAERIKLEHGSTSDAIDLRKKDEIDLSVLMPDEPRTLPRKQLARVIDARAHEVLDMTIAELKKISREGNLPAGVVLTGGGVHLPGFAALAKEKLRLPVRIAHSPHVDGMPEVIADPTFTVALGLVMWGLDMEYGSGKTRISSVHGEGDGLLGRAVRWIKNFLP